MCADDDQAGLQPLIVLFSAGNDGGWNSPYNGCTSNGPDNVGSPGTAKNVITVGNNETDRGSDPNCGGAYSGKITHAATNGHVHPWEHTVYILEGSGAIVIGGKSYTVTAGDAILVPPNARHQWKNETQAPMLRVTFNPVSSEKVEH